MVKKNSLVFPYRDIIIIVTVLYPLKAFHRHNQESSMCWVIVITCQMAYLSLCKHRTDADVPCDKYTLIANEIINVFSMYYERGKKQWMRNNYCAGHLKCKFFPPNSLVFSIQFQLAPSFSQILQKFSHPCIQNFKENATKIGPFPEFVFNAKIELAIFRRWYTHLKVSHKKSDKSDEFKCIKCWREKKQKKKCSSNSVALIFTFTSTTLHHL